MILMETARFYHPKLVRDIRAASLNLDHLGREALTHFVCSNYLSELHIDHDKIRSLCAQYEWDAKPGEFGFVYAKHGVYFETRSNCFWYVPIASLISFVRYARVGIGPLTETIYTAQCSLAVNLFQGRLLRPHRARKYHLKRLQEVVEAPESGPNSPRPTRAHANACPRAHT